MRKVVIVILLITILLLPCFVWADGIMSIKLPPPPAGVDNFVCGYMPKLGTYRLGSTDYDGSIYISKDGTLVNSAGKVIDFGDRYELVDGSWVKYSSYYSWSSWYDDIGSVDSEQGKVIVFSSNDFYGRQGQLLASAASDDVLRNGLTVIGDHISSSKILMYMFSPFRQIVLYIVVAIVSIIALYKAWGWLRGQVQGI